MSEVYTKVKHFYNEILKDDNHRFKSWEHCFNYFSQNEIELDKACLHLSFYLASWGMYRGSSDLLWKDYLIHKEVVELIVSDKYKVLQKMSFTNEEIVKIIELTKEIRKIYKKKITYVKGKKKDINISDTLVTKILLGTLGCVPAYDRFFLDAWRIDNKDQRKWTLTFNENSLHTLIEFYRKTENKIHIDKLAKEIGYPVMKILDMYFWQIGYENSPEGRKDRYEQV